MVLERFGRAEEAISSYDRALELQPDDAGILANRADSLLTLGRHEEAMANLDKLLQIGPNCTGAYYNKTCNFALPNQVELALGNLQRAIELEPETYRDLAKTDTDFDGIRGDVRFHELLSNGVTENKDAPRRYLHDLWKTLIALAHYFPDL
jgi:tetratricopeptide (TPR) repeat protein